MRDMMKMIELGLLRDMMKGRKKEKITKGRRRMEDY